VRGLWLGTFLLVGAWPAALDAQEPQSIPGDEWGAQWVEVSSIANRTLRHLARSVGRLESEDDVGPLCTLTLIAPSIVVTARHCVQGEGRPIRWARFGYLDGGSGGERFRIVGVIEHGHLDWALVRLEGRPGDTWGVLEAPSRRVNRQERDLFILHHPQGRPMRLSGPCSGSRSMGSTELHHDCHTQHISSGAPSFARDGTEYRLVGIHTNGGLDMDPGSFNRGVPFDSIATESRRLPRREWVPLERVEIDAQLGAAGGEDRVGETAYARGGPVLRVGMEWTRGEAQIRAGAELAFLAGDRSQDCQLGAYGAAGIVLEREYRVSLLATVGLTGSPYGEFDAVEWSQTDDPEDARTAPGVGLRAGASLQALDIFFVDVRYTHYVGMQLEVGPEYGRSVIALDRAGWDVVAGFNVAGLFRLAQAQ